MKKIIIAIYLFLLLTVFVLLCMPNLLSHLILDDAYIFLRFVRNCLNGYGIVWNIGEHPVEGFSSFLYFFLLLAISKLINVPLDIVLQPIGIVFSIGTIIFVYILSNKIIKNPYLALMPTTFLACSPSFIMWSSNGMDTSIYLFFFVVFVYLYTKSSTKNIYFLSIVSVLFALARTEALLIIFITFIFEMYQRIKSTEKVFDKSIIIAGLIFIVCYGSFFIWRWHYFGYLFSNTYYAKTGGGIYQIIGGFKDAISSFSTFFTGFSALILLPIFFHKINKNLHWEENYLLVLTIVISISNILVGGDVFHVRFYLPVFVILLILSTYSFYTFKKVNNFKKIIGLTYLLLIPILTFCSFYNTDTYKEIRRLYRDVPTYIKKINSYPSTSETNAESYYDSKTTFRAITDVLNDTIDPNSSIALVAVGTIGYYSNFTIYDMVGKVDERIAHTRFDDFFIKTWRPGHDKGDGIYILSRKPDYILLNSILTREPAKVPSSFDMQYKSVVEI